MELTVVARELKLKAIHVGIIIHQYLDDWLVKAKSHQVCLQHTLDLVKICQVLDNVLTGQPLHPNKTWSANFYRCIKSRVGHSLKRTHCKRHLVPSGKQVAYQLPRTQGSLSSLKRVPRPLHTQDSTCRDRQHHSGVIHKEGRRHEVGPTLCFTMDNLDLVHQKSSNSQSPIDSRPAECGRRQAIQARPDHPNRVVSPSGGLPSNMQQVAPASNRPICHLVQQHVAFVSPVPDPLATAVDALSLPL